MRTADFYLERGLLALKSRNYEAAAADLADALKINPQLVEAWCVRGNIRTAQGMPFDALLHYDAALAIKPEAFDLWNNRGLAFADLGNWANAELSFKKSIELSDTIEPHMNLANLYAGLMRLKDAATEYRRAIDFEPANYEAHLNLGVTLLGLGEWKEGWKEYFWRHKGTPYPNRYQREYTQWQGEDLNGKSITLWPEQGYGDEILFSRAAHWIERRYPEAKVFLTARTPLASLLTPRNPIDLPKTDYACSTIDAVGLIGSVEVSTFAHGIKPASELGGRLVPIAGLKVGICWSAGQRPLQPDTKATSVNKSIPFGMVTELLRTEGVTFVSLQKEHSEHARLRDLGVLDFMDEVHNFDDTASIIKGLSLVISVDTAVAHLAGVLDVPVWNLVRYAGYWPWLHPDISLDQAIWYPSMTLYRQPQLFDWAEPLSRVKHDLIDMVASSRKRRAS